MTTRREFLFSVATGVALTAVPLTAFPAEPYVVFPHWTWVEERDLDVWSHVTRFRAFRPEEGPLGAKMFGIGARISREIAETRGVESYLGQYNAALEAEREKNGYSREMVRLAARGEYSGRWVWAGERWMKYHINPVDSDSWSITA